MNLFTLHYRASTNYIGLDRADIAYLLDVPCIFGTDRKESRVLLYHMTDNTYLHLEHEAGVLTSALYHVARFRTHVRLQLVFPVRLGSSVSPQLAYRFKFLLTYFSFLSLPKFPDLEMLYHPPLCTAPSRDVTSFTIPSKKIVLLIL
jgi:hypothetical protein